MAAGCATAEYTERTMQCLNRSGIGQLLVWVVFTPWAAPACEAEEPPLIRFELTEPHMGTQFRIVLYAPDADSGRAAARTAFDRIGQLDAMLSDYRDDSELMSLCRQAGGPPVRVSDELFYVLRQSRELSERSDGAFDVTAGPVIRLWRRARRVKQMPDPSRLAQALTLVGSDKLQLDEQTRSVQLLKPGMVLDLGGIAKGYAVDEALEQLKEHGISRALVAGSGDIRVGDPPPGEPGWTIGIGPLESGEKSPSRFLLLSHAAVSTSGDAEQFVELGGKRYSHIVDPRTGLGVVGRSSVMVVAPMGITADGLATAVSVLGPERGLKLVESTEDTAALIMRATEDGEETFESLRFRTLPRGRPKPAAKGEIHRSTPPPVTLPRVGRSARCAVRPA